MADDFNNLVWRRDSTRNSYNERKREIERLEEKREDYRMQESILMNIREHLKGNKVRIKKL